MAREWGWRLAEIMTDSDDAIGRIAKHVGDIPRMTEIYDWASGFADVETVVSDSLYLAAYDYAGVGDFRGWWNRKLRGQLSYFRGKAKKNQESASNVSSGGVSTSHYY